jgi:hypothetical protein
MKPENNIENTAGSDCPAASCSPSWRFKLYCQRPHIGSDWWRGNFSLGIMVDSHLRFVNVIFAFVFVEVVCGFSLENSQFNEPELR